MREYRLRGLLCTLVLTSAGFAAAKPHVIVFGKWTPVKLFLGTPSAAATENATENEEERSVEIKIRPLYVDGQLKEFTTGEPYDVTDRQFVVRRAYRLNDWLPEDVEKAAALPAGKRTSHRFQWQRGGWLLVDRTSGRISQLRLPDFDPFYSTASWYRDYVAYCGISDDGEKLYAVVAQLGHSKAIVRKQLRAASGSELPDSECPAPEWQRQPARVMFAPVGSDKITFSIRGHAGDVMTATEPEESSGQ